MAADLAHLTLHLRGGVVNMPGQVHVWTSGGTKQALPLFDTYWESASFVHYKRRKCHVTLPVSTDGHCMRIMRLTRVRARMHAERISCHVDRKIKVSFLALV